MMDKVRNFLKFEIKFVTESLLSLLLLLTLVEILLGPLLMSGFYLISLVENLNNQVGFLMILLLIGAYAWAIEDEYVSRR
jgi:hypothetical protein|tara:strand:+ start:4232 stop:4471 length:240 start_codon:yes stop_codon:yes gene_type:complete